MSLAVVYSRAQMGIQAPLITVETHLSNGLPGLSIVGLPETAVKESKDRVRSAIINSHFEFPQRRITINLAPADLPKEGGRYDLPIALGILAASEQIPKQSLCDKEFIGELALSGELRAVQGSLPAALACFKKQHHLLVPKDNAEEASMVKALPLYACSHLLEVCAHLNGRKPLSPVALKQAPHQQSNHDGMDIRDIKGQTQAKRALEIAAAGNHNLIFIGPPGSGKTMLASRLPGILPPLTEKERLKVAAVHSISGERKTRLTPQRPFRSPHHTASPVALVGGGSHPKPGEISLAHNGVLFLDELPEFQRQVLEVMREPLESGEIAISRANAQTVFPARFQLIAAMNPCPCGFFGESPNRCRCTPDQIRRYRSKISGPLLDRVDLHVMVPALKQRELQQSSQGESTSTILQRVQRCRQLQLERNHGKTNSVLNNTEIEAFCELGKKEQTLMEQALNKLQLSARAYHRILKVARTIADMEGSQPIQNKHLAEALGYRQLDRQNMF